MANPAAFALRRPRVVVLAMLLVTVYGLLAWLDLPRQENPRIQERFVDVSVYLPGAEPEKVERLITRPLEEKIDEVDDVNEIFSSSSVGLSFTRVEIHPDAPVAERILELREKVQEARDAFPAGASEPEVRTELLRTQTLLVALVGDAVDPRVLRRAARDLEHELERLAEVRRVSLLGLPREEIEIAVDLRALSQRGIALTRVIDALAERNADLPGGELELGSTRSSIRTSGAFDRVQQVGATVLQAGRERHATRVSDVAEVRRGLADPEVVARYTGERAVSIAVEMLDGRNVVAFGERVRAWLEARAATLPPGLRLVVVADEPSYVAGRLARLSWSLLVGMGLVATLVVWGMGWRAGVIVSLSIPLSVVVAFGALDVFGIALQQMSIAALVIGMGLVVDEAIVVSDSIKRRIEAGVEPRRAAVEGLGDVHLAVLAGVATTIAAFFPLYVMQGDIGEFIRSIPLVVSSMLVASAGVAHFVTPLAMAWAHRSGTSPPAAAPESSATRRYALLLDACARHPGRVLGLFAAGLVAALVGIATVLSPPVFFSKADRSQLVIDVRLPPSARVEQTETVLAQIAELLAAEPRVKDWISFAGSDAPKVYYNEFPGGRGESLGMLVVNTRAELGEAGHAELASDLNARFEGALPDAWIRARQLAQGYAVAADLSIYLTGDRIEGLRALSARIAALARDVPGVVDARDSFGYDPVTLEARVLDDRAAALGISHEAVARTLRTAMDGVTATTFPDDDEEIDVVVRLARTQRRGADDLEGLRIHSPAAGRSVPLAQVAEIVPAFTTGLVQRWNRKREAVIEVTIEGRNVVAVTNAIEAVVASQLALPPGYAADYQGERQEVNDSFLSLAKAGVVAIFLIYIILVVRFRSLAQPLLIVLASPMALMGAVLGLVVTGNPLGFTAFLGFIALTGIVVNDSIVLVDTVNRLRASGVALDAAVRRGARQRLRPVLLTSATTIGGLLPLSLAGGSFWAPFGFVMIFGLAASTILTLLVQPTAYRALESRIPREADDGGELRGAADAWAAGGGGAWPVAEPRSR